MTEPPPQLLVLDELDPRRSRALAKQLSAAAPGAVVVESPDLRFPADLAGGHAPLVALVHWYSSAVSPRAREIKALLTDLLDPDAGAVPRRSLRAIIPYSGGGGPVLEAGLPGMVLGDPVSYLLPVDAAPIPVLSLQARLDSGMEVSPRAFSTVIQWCLQGDLLAPLPQVLRPPPSWKPVALVLLQGYLAARDPDFIDLSQQLRQRSRQWVDRVYRLPWWRPLAMVLDPGRPDQTVGEVLLCLAYRIKQELGFDLDIKQYWQEDTEASDLQDRQIRQLWEALTGLKTRGRAG